MPQEPPQTHAQMVEQAGMLLKELSNQIERIDVNDLWRLEAGLLGLAARAGASAAEVCTWRSTLEHEVGEARKTVAAHFA